MSTAEKLDTDGIKAMMLELGANARTALGPLSQATAAAKDLALTTAASALRNNTEAIIEANKQDMQYARDNGMAQSKMDRLMLDADRIEGVAQALESIAAMDDPVGSVIADWEVPSGLKINRVRVPLGVIGIIYESRPNVTADAGALCLKAGNAAILRGGSDSYHSARAIFACLQEGLAAAGLPEHSLQLVPTRDREAVGEMLRMNQYIDVIVPRGGRSLIERVMSDSRVPIFAHLEGLCHVYVDRDADLQMARDITLNAKTRRTSICGAAETLLVDKACADTHLVPLLQDLAAAGVEIHGDATVCDAMANVIPANEEDWVTEYLDMIIAVRVVDGVDEAMTHIDRYGSHHTECIVTDNVDTAEKFLARVDSAILLHNASTQYADGGEFGMGAEIGISTGRMHARGPVGVEQLTTFKYVVRGQGQTRP